MKRSILLILTCVVIAVFWTAGVTAESDCAACHEEVDAGMTNQIHMRIQSFEVLGRTVGCEGCHGDGIEHMDEGDAALIRTFAEEDSTDACLECHQGKGQSEWKASTHAMEGLTCLDCHSIHTASNPLNSCRECHADTMSEFQLPSHHPVREGKMSCVDCHDPHAATEAQLNTKGRVNDLCFNCHQDKEGPFIFEHDPVVEDCRICHTAHGSVANNLLTANEPMLCYQCHEPHFHAALLSPPGTIEVGGTERENPFGESSMNVAYTTKCSQCHPKVHGTDLPSQTLAGGGRGLVR